MKMKFDFDAMLAVLPKALEGWLGVFVVIGIIIVATYLLNCIFSKR